MAGETQNYHETRNPHTQTADYASVSLSTTSKSVLTVTTGDLLGSSLSFPAGYWETGKKVHFRFFGKFTTVATPGNLTIEIRHQTGTPSDAGGTILQTSAATALAASKTNISWFCDFTVEARGPISSTAGSLFGKGWFMYDGAGGLFTTTSQNPLFIPASAATGVTSLDTTLASYITLQMKRSGSSAEAVVVQDYQVNSLT